MEKIFNVNVPKKVKKSAFNLSHERKLSTAMGRLTPILCEEVMPGDKWSIDTQSFVRFAPMIAPMMHRVNSYIHFFFVPNRLLWSQWEKFITNQETLTVPHIGIPEVVEVGGLADHLGIPPGTTQNSTDINTLPFRAYFKIWNDYYRDENFETEWDIENGDSTILEQSLKMRNWEKDYFTSAFNAPQKGSAVAMNANVEYSDIATALTGGQTPLNGNVRLDGGMIENDNDEKLTVQNIDSVSINVEELRFATRLQRFLERNMRSGNRYIEYLLAQWKVRTSDARLQRAEYLGGGKSPVVVSEVLNTAGVDIPQGQMAGHGINVGRTNQAYKYCEEHGYIMAIMSVMPEPSYFQGLHKKFTRMDYLDFPIPEFAQLGEQAIQNREIFFQDAPEDLEVWGYQSRYAEMKYIPSSVHGEFRDTLDFWHMGRKFQSLPTLGYVFNNCDPTTRVFATEYQDMENLWINVYHKITAVRSLPYYNNPTL